MIGPLLALPPQSRKRLVQGLACGALSLAPTEMALRSTTGIAEGAAGVAESLAKLGARGLDARGVAALIETLDVIESRRHKPDLVWSGPEAPGVYARDTRQVYEELIEGAERSLWLSSFVYFDGSKAFETLSEQMEKSPALRVRLILNIQRPHGDTTEASALVARFAQQLWSDDWPGKVRPEVYYARSSVDQHGLKGVLHAKVIVADDERLFVTSANLTEAAFDRNIEAGVLLRDGVLALSVVRHFSGLIDSGYLARLPAPTAS